MSARRLRLVGLVVGLGLAAGVAGEAAAHSCIRHAWETLDLELVEAREDGAVIAASVLPFALREAVNSAQMGEWVLVRGEAQGAFFSIKEAFEPSEIQAEHMRYSAERRAKTGCGYQIRYTPVKPGRYAYEEEWSSAERPLPQGMTLLVAGDRQTLGLAYEREGHRYEVEYRVTCAHYDWEDGRGRCGPREEPAPILDAPRGKDREPPRIEPTVAAPEGSEPPPLDAGSGGCVVVGIEAPGAATMLLLLALAARGRRRGVRGERRP
ncbi:MAG: hypothetical protein KC420_13980 [Myxococcales bacterium]|nr:hypothetical protein [Myxococcales bacterium]